jgi:hypothetical protein
MEYRIELFGALPAAATIAALLEREDAAAVSDLEPGGRVWRVSTSLGSDELLALFARAGCQVSPAQLQRVPSVCCGGCSG